ncbi:protein kinase [Prosthecobacter sp.]|uniref:protein kinase domain-containing protein n=1 Tax=Prosthecobacter sp. TaxID=1965333 RepID=UPI001D28DA87|nr:protein kinase [Prosthecobacter sp.]MCB1278370.1 protein kinase [Prosthecobacter sp.]
MAERYKIYEKLGMGGVGAVFRAYDSQLKRWVAVKRLLSANEANLDKNTASELRREADALASLRNPNIVTIFDVASDEEGLFMVMELLQGEDLADVVSRGPLPYDDFKELASQTLEGLLAAHQHHILHRDIKPENIKVERLPGGRMQAKIIDFGLARAGLRARKQTEDQEGTVMGSIYYMAPEQLTREPVDERTDLYSLGCVFYEALSGRKAFDGASMAEVIDKHIDHVLTPLHEIAPHVPQWLGAWCARLMAQKPDDRPANAQQAIEEFRAWEKMPTMVPYGPWMGMYVPPPVYMPPGTGTVPLTGYYPPAETQPAVYAEPVVEAVAVQIVPEASPVVEVAAITTPLAPAPRKPATGATSAMQRRTSSVQPPAPQTGKSNSKLIKQIAIIGGGAVVLILGGCFFFGGSGVKKPGGGQSVMTSIGLSSNPPKVSFQLPQDRSYPPVDRGICLFYVGNTGNLTNRKGSDGKPAQANTNEPVVEWHDLSERGGDNILRSYQKSPDYAPRRVNWPEASTGGTPRAGRVVLDFHARNGKPCALELDDTGKEVQNMPFGSNSVPGSDKGLTVVAAFQADSSKLPTRLFTFGNEDGTTVSLRVDEKKNVVTEVLNKGGSPTLTSKDVDGTIACLALISWNASTGAVELRVRDSAGKAYASSGGKSSAPSSPLTSLQIGMVKDDKGASASSKDQFNGHLAEFFVYSAALKTDQLQLIDGRVRDYYFLPSAPSPLQTRLKTKLSWVEPRSSWKLSASSKKELCTRAIDGNTGSRWESGASMKGGEWFTVELPNETTVAGLALDSQGNNQDYLRGYKIEMSADGKQWGAPVAEGTNTSSLTEIVFKAPQKGRFLRVTQTGKTGQHWGINELVLFKP